MFAANLGREHHGGWTEPASQSQSTLATFKERREDIKVWTGLDDPLNRRRASGFGGWSPVQM
jgi:hypothetical protein